MHLSFVNACIGFDSEVLFRLFMRGVIFFLWLGHLIGLINLLTTDFQMIIRLSILDKIIFCI